MFLQQLFLACFGCFSFSFLLCLHSFTDPYRSLIGLPDVFAFTFSLNGFLSRHSFGSVVTNRLVITTFLKSFSWFFLLYFFDNNSVRWLLDPTYYSSVSLTWSAFLLTLLIWCLYDKHRWHFAFHVLGSQMFVALVLRSLVYHSKVF